MARSCLCPRGAAAAALEPIHAPDLDERRMLAAAAIRPVLQLDDHGGGLAAPVNAAHLPATLVMRQGALAARMAWPTQRDVLQNSWE
jgi:hypothetical protein